MKRINKELDANFFIKIELFLFCFFFISEIIINNKIEYNNSLEDHINQILCRLFYFERNYNCSNKIFINRNIYDDIIDINPNIHLLLNIKYTKIESIFLLIGILPFLKNNSTITIQINDKTIYKLFKNVFNNKKFRKTIIINQFDFHFLEEKLIDLINYKWELIPELNISQTMRYIINHFYKEIYLNNFDQLLNLNFKYYIENKKSELTNEQIKELMSKFYLIIYFMN